MSRNRLFYLLELLVAAALYFFENNSGTRAVLAASVLAPLLSILCAYGCSRKAAFSLELPAVCEKGTALVCRASASPLFFCDAHLALRLRNELTGEEACAAAFAGSVAKLPVSHSGLLTVSIDHVELRDAFGLCRFAVPADCTRQTFAPPKRFPAQVTLSASPAQTREDSRLSAVQRGDDFGETVAIRPYAPGDPVHQIHWKLSAKMGRTMLRETGAPLTGDLLLALAADFEDAPDPDALEASLCGLLSASRALLEQGVSHWVSFWRRAPMLVAAPEDWERAQRALLAGPASFDEADCAFARAAVFAPRTDVNVSDPDARVTLVLPEDAQALVGDIPVAFFGEHAPFLSL